MALNRAEIIGNLGADPDIRTFPDGGKVASLSVATTRKWRDRQSGEAREDTEWHRVSVTASGLAGVVERYLRKGAKVYIAGRLRTRKWQDKSGADRYTTEIVVAGFEGVLEMLGDARAAARPPPSDPDPSGGAGGAGHAPLDDEIPF